MMNINKKTPKLRFKGFTDGWEQRKLIYIFNDFIVPMRDKPKVFSGTTPWTRIEDIEGRYINTSLSGQFVSDEIIKSMNLKVIPRGSLIVSASATFGVVAIVTNDLITNQTFIGLVPNKDFDIDFLYSLFEAPTTKGKLLKLSAGSTIFYIARESFENLVLSVPSKEEQIKISKVFKSIDDSITLHQRKLEKLKLAKKALLQKLFPKNGSQFPEIRFKGFTDAWEQRKLDDVFQIIDGDRGKNYPGTCDFLSNGDVLFLDTGNVRKDGFNFDNKRYIDFNRDKLLRNGRLILGDYVLTSRGTLGNLAYYSQSIYNKYPQIRINSAMLILRVMNTIKVNNLYLYITLRSNVINEFMKHNFVGSAQPHITKKEFSSVLLPIPRQLEEQKIIGDFFDKLEKIITLHQRKLNRLISIKKAFLQQLFV